MTDGWTSAPLERLLRKAGDAVNVSTIGEVPYAGVRLYAKGLYRREAADARTVKAKSLTRIREGQVVYNRMWATRGSFGVAGPDVDGCLVTNDFPVFEVGDEALPGYFALLFQTPQFQSMAAASAIGTTERRRLHVRDFLALYVNLPPLAEQRRIVDLIEAVDALEREAVREARAASVLVRSLREDLLDHASHRRLGDLLVDIDGGVSPQTEGRPPIDGEPSVLKLSAVRPGRFHPEEAKALPAGVEMPERALAKPGDVLITRSNTPEKVGHVCVVDRVKPSTYLSDLILRLHPTSEVLPDYLAEALLTDDARAQIVGSARGTSGSMRKISRATIRELTVPVFGSLDRQRDVVSLVGVAARVRDRADDAAASARSLRTTLVANLLTGEHIIPDAYDRFLEIAA